MGAQWELGSVSVKNKVLMVLVFPHFLGDQYRQNGVYVVLATI